MKNYLRLSGQLFDVVFAVALVVMAVISDSSMELGVWVAALFAFSCFVLLERVLERLTNPVVSVYINNASPEEAQTIIRDAFRREGQS